MAKKIIFVIFGNNGANIANSIDCFESTLIPNGWGCLVIYFLLFQQYFSLVGIKNTFVIFGHAKVQY